MLNFGQQLVRIRRFLRDPNHNIWTDDFLKNIYNDCQKEIQIKTGYLEDVSVLGIPPLYQWAYLYDWEWSFMDGSKFHQALQYHQQGDFAFCYFFEPQVDLGFSSDANDWGSHFTQPWEAWTSLVPGEVVSIKFPDNFHSVQMLAYDREPLESVRRKDVTQRDTSYVTYHGEPRWYWREDDLDNSFVPYPRPTTVVWNDVKEQSDPDFIYTHSWEADEHDGTGSNWTRTDSTNERQHVFLWESDSSLTDYMRGMYVFEAGLSGAGMVLYVEDDTTDVVGTVSLRTGSLFNQEEGVAIQVLEDTSNFLLVYDITPEDVQTNQDESDFPIFMRKYIEHQTISRAYGANTDGKIQSLSDYWKYRYEVGVGLIQRFMGKKKEDRDYRLVTSSRDALRTKRHPRLPSSYPAV